jgi:hypothetical protein
LTLSIGGILTLTASNILKINLKSEEPLKNLKTSNGPCLDLDLPTNAEKVPFNSRWTVHLSGAFMYEKTRGKRSFASLPLKSKTISAV